MLKIRELSAGYGKVQVLHGISIDVPRGKVVTLIGSNGAGKTTTMRAVSGMIAPSGGQIELAGATSRDCARTRSPAWVWPTHPRAGACSRCSRSTTISRLGPFPA